MEVREEVGDDTASDSDPHVIRFPFIPDPENPPTPPTTPPVQDVQGVQDEPTLSPIEEVLALPSTGSRTADQAIAWLLVASIAAIGVGGTLLLALRFSRRAE